MSAMHMCAYVQGAFILHNSLFDLKAVTMWAQS